MSRLKTPNFGEHIMKYNFVIVTETKCDDVDTSIIMNNFSNMGYSLLFKIRKKLSAYRSGGIIVFVRNKYWSNTKKLSSNSSSCLRFRINKNVLGFDKDLLCGALYIPPKGSKYSDTTRLYFL